jgi:uncharacterized DUF497 family protein
MAIRGCARRLARNEGKATRVAPCAPARVGVNRRQAFVRPSSVSRKFDWDPNKAARNLAKHGISFDEAETAFDDPRRVVKPDELHSETEDRWIVIGRTNQGRLAVIVCTKRNGRIRLISARRTTPRERRDHEDR